jgi:hypothetical protein
VGEARCGRGDCRELEAGRYRVSFVLGEDAAVYSGLGRLLERVRHCRATEVYEDKEQASVFDAKRAWRSDSAASFRVL